MSDAILAELRGRRLPSLRRQEAADYCSNLGLDNSGSRATLLSRLKTAILQPAPQAQQQAARTTRRAAATSSTSAAGRTRTTTSQEQPTTSLATGHVPASTNSAFPILPPTLTNTVWQPPPTVAVQVSQSTPATATPVPTPPSWVQSIAQQAAQSAINQVLHLHTVDPTFPPGGSLQTTQPITVASSQPVITPASSQSIMIPAPIPPAPAQLPLLPSSSTATLPVLPNLPIGASTAITGYNLPGEISGMLPHTIISKILTLQYFDLSLLLPSNLALARNTQQIRVHVGGDDGQQLLVSRRPQNKKPISSISDWMLAFCTYAAVITTADHTRGPDLFEYARIIVQAEHEYKDDSWLRYDTAFRTRAANRHLVRWADIDSTLWNRAFSGMSKATACCSICLDTSHSMVDCPLYSQGSAPRRNTLPAGPSNSSGSIPSTSIIRQVCINWNRGKCRFPNCRRAHVCATQGCGGEHKYPDCPKRRRSPRKSTTPAD